MINKVIFISWAQYCRHSYLLSNALGADIYYVSGLIKSRGIIWKLFFLFDYISKSLRTLSIILKIKPNIIYVQNPPSLAPIFIVLLKKLLKFKVVVDSHNGAFQRPWSSFPFHKWALRNADLVSIHNTQLHSRILGDPFYEKINFKILNSKLSEFQHVKKEKPLKPYFLIITTFAGDEPMEVLLESIKEFNNNNGDMIFKITGNYNKKPHLFLKYSTDKNIEFLGFIDYKELEYFLVNSFGVISLSTRDDVQQFALMESLGADVPFISNDNRTNRALFDNKMVLVEITTEKIAEGIELFIKDKEIFDKNIIELKNIIRTKWEKDFSLIKSELGI